MLSRRPFTSICVLLALSTTSVTLSTCRKDAPARSPQADAAIDSPRAAIDRGLNAFYRRGVPTFVTGTTGDDRTDLELRRQITFLRDMLFPHARIVDDTSFDPRRGPSAWPANAVLYGSPRNNAVLAAIESSLPFRVSDGVLEVGSVKLSTTDARLITVVPALKGTIETPSFLLYASSGHSGIGEINAVRVGDDEITIADAFGVLASGTWSTTTPPQPQLTPLRHRVAWRQLVVPILRGGTLHVAFPEQIAARPNEHEIVAACARGVERVVQALELQNVGDLTIYVYPDRNSKRSITQDAGDGHAIPAARAVHVVEVNPQGLEKLIAHEGTHVLAYHHFATTGTPLFGEGLAVWVSGQYGGQSLATHRATLEAPHDVTNLLGITFRKVPESRSYPTGGLLVQFLVERYGLELVRTQLFPATPRELSDRWHQLGTSETQLNSEFSQWWKNGPRDS